MIKTKVYAVVDKKAKSIVSIFTSLSDEAAERSFLSLLTGPKNIFTDFPEDFALFPVCDLGCPGNLTVSRPGIEVLESAGFKVDSFTIFDPIKDGASYDKRYLAMVHADRFPLLSDSVVTEEVSEDA